MYYINVCPDHVRLEKKPTPTEYLSLKRRKKCREKYRVRSKLRKWETNWENENKALCWHTFQIGAGLLRRFIARKRCSLLKNELKLESWICLCRAGQHVFRSDARDRQANAESARGVDWVGWWWRLIVMFTTSTLGSDWKKVGSVRLPRRTRK